MILLFEIRRVELSVSTAIKHKCFRTKKCAATDSILVNNETKFSAPSAYFSLTTLGLTSP